MNWRNITARIFLFGALVFATQHFVIAMLPRLVFEIAKHRFGQPLNTIFHAPRTDARSRKVVLPNPDFIYSSCLFDAGHHDIVLKGEFPDASQYCSLSFYDSEVQPYDVLNNDSGSMSFEIRLSTKGTPGSIAPKTSQGAVLLRILAADASQLNEALRIQKTFSVSEE